ncbi:MAG TPA: hypothetical protein VD996_04790 [Chitinophagaceae bacterium]|nr:hypothetical protein [Chitinophagaceae bacterium]
MSDNNKNQDTNLGQQGNQNWDDQNDQPTRGTTEPNPQRFSQEEEQNQNTGSGGSAFNEQNTSGYGSSQRGQEDSSVGPLDSDLADLPSQKRSGNNQTGPGLG